MAMVSEDRASSSRLQSTSFTQCIDPDAPLFIAKSTVLSALTGGVFGSSVGLARSVNPVDLGGRMATRWFVLSSAFFGLREYLVSPLLVATRATRQHSARGNEYLVGTASPTTVSDMRTSRLLDSAIVGALGGPAMSPTFRRALRSRRPLVALQHLAGASLTAALISSFLQIAVNQSRVLRISYLARRESRPVPIQRSEEKSTSEQVRDAFQNPVRDPGGEKLGEKSLPGRIMRTLSTFLPIQNLSDEEYLEALERKKGEVEKRLLEIEREEGRIYEYASRGGREA